MFTGQLWLDYDVDGFEGRYQANVTRALIRGDEIAIEFSGTDPDDGPFSGSCHLEKKGAFFTGSGHFSVRKDSQSASVVVALKREDGCVSLTGSWQDSGDSEAYDFTVELEEAKV